MEHLDYIKDLDATINAKFKCDHHIKEKVNKSYAVLSIIYRNFKYMPSDTVVMLYKDINKITH